MQWTLANPNHTFYVLEDTVYKLCEDGEFGEMLDYFEVRHKWC